MGANPFRFDPPVADTASLVPPTFVNQQSPGRTLVKRFARMVATVLVVPALLSFWLRSLLIGRARAFEASTHALSLIPGLGGQYIRRAFLTRVLRRCDPTAVVSFGTVLSQADASIGPNVYIGPHCDLGLVEIERDALIAAGVHIPSGPYTHGTGTLTTPTREQPGYSQLVRVGVGAGQGNVGI